MITSDIAWPGWDGHGMGREGEMGASSSVLCVGFLISLGGTKQRLGLPIRGWGCGCDCLRLWLDGRV